jgi:hypothetical protein
MFGHGQIEGFTEKYGMEYYRPRYEEWPNQGLVDRHMREIAPLLKRRWLFAESADFLLYDFFTGGGAVDENVYAYSNRSGAHRALVVFNNRYGTTRGTIDWSAAYAEKGSGQLRQRRLCDGLAFSGGNPAIIAWRDSLTGLQFLKRKQELLHGGLTLELGAYQSHVFIDWQELHATQNHPWDRLCDHLNGRGVPSLEDALLDLELAPAHRALQSVLAPDEVRRFAGLAEQAAGRAGASGSNPASESDRRRFLEEFWPLVERFLSAAQTFYKARIDHAARPDEPVMLGYVLQRRLRAALRLPLAAEFFTRRGSDELRRVLPSPSPKVESTAVWGPVLAWIVLELLAESLNPEHPAEAGAALFGHLRLREPLARCFEALGFEGEEAWRAAARIRTGLMNAAAMLDAAPEGAAGVNANDGKASPAATEPEEPAGESGSFPREETAENGEEKPAQPALNPSAMLAIIPRNLWNDPDVQWLAGVHRADEKLYLVREQCEELLWWMQLPRLLRLAENPERNKTGFSAAHEDAGAALAEAETMGYRAEPLLESTRDACMADEEPGCAEKEEKPAADHTPSQESSAQTSPRKMPGTADGENKDEREKTNRPTARTVEVHAPDQPDPQRPGASSTLATDKADGTNGSGLAGGRNESAGG